MSSPDDWAWLEEMPEAWPTPEEIAGPTGIPTLNLVIVMLSSEMLGNDLLELAGDFVAEEARFNRWIGTDGKSRLSMRELAEHSLLLRECMKSIYTSWSEFAKAHEEANRAAGSAEAERQLLYANLKSAVEMLRQARLG